MDAPATDQPAGSALRVFYPGALAASDDLARPDALAVLGRAPTPERGRQLSTAQIRSALAGGGRQRNLHRRSAEIRDALRAPQLAAPPRVARAHGAIVTALVRVIAGLREQIAALEAELTEHLEAHPDAEVLRRLPGLGIVLAARVLAEFGDALNRYADDKARRDYAGTAPITRASGTSEVVLARMACHKRLFDACWRWAFCALRASPGARSYHDAHNPGPRAAKTARRKLANKLVGVLHGCLAHRQHHDEDLARANWIATDEAAA